MRLARPVSDLTPPANPKAIAPWADLSTPTPATKDLGLDNRPFGSESHLKLGEPSQVPAASANAPFDLFEPDLQLVRPSASRPEVRSAAGTGSSPRRAPGEMLRLAIFEQREVFGAEVFDRNTVVVLDHDIHQDLVYLRREGGWQRRRRPYLGCASRVLGTKRDAENEART
jgi:hypothetical protein